MDSLLPILCTILLLYRSEILAFLLPLIQNDSKQPTTSNSFTEDIPDVCRVSSSDSSFSSTKVDDQTAVQVDGPSTQTLRESKHDLSDGLSTESRISELSYACDSTSSPPLERIRQTHEGDSCVQNHLHIDSIHSLPFSAFSSLEGNLENPLISSSQDHYKKVSERATEPLNTRVLIDSNASLDLSNLGRHSFGSDGDHDSVIDMKVALHTSLKLRSKLLRQAAIGRPHSSSNSSSSSQCSVQATNDELEHVASLDLKNCMRPAVSRRASLLSASNDFVKAPTDLQEMESEGLITAFRSILKSADGNKTDNIGRLFDRSTQQTNNGAVRKCVRMNVEPLTFSQARRRSSLGVEFSHTSVEAASTVPTATFGHSRRRASVGYMILPPQEAASGAAPTVTSGRSHRRVSIGYTVVPPQQVASGADSMAPTVTPGRSRRRASIGCTVVPLQQAESGADLMAPTVTPGRSRRRASIGFTVVPLQQAESGAAPIASTPTPGRSRRRASIGYTVVPLQQAESGADSMTPTVTPGRSCRRASIGYTVLPLQQAESVADSMAPTVTPGRSRRRASIGYTVLPSQQAPLRQSQPQRRLMPTPGKGDQLILDRMRTAAMRRASEH